MVRNDIKWSVFRQREDRGEVHVIPSYADGLILEHHVVDVLCPCDPVPEPAGYNGIIIVDVLCPCDPVPEPAGYNGIIIVVHNEPEVER
jgi:hypothetical protein